MLAGEAQQGAAGGQHVQARTAAEQVAHQRRGVQHMLEAVQHQEQAPVSKVADQALCGRAARRIRDGQRPRNGRSHQVRGTHRRQRDVGDTVGEGIGRARGDLEAQAGLAAAGRPGER